MPTDSKTRIVHILLRNVARESAILRMLKTLANAGYQITLLTLPEGEIPDTSDAPNLTIEHVRLKSRKRVGQSWPMRFIQFLEFAFRAFARMKKLQPVLIHCHDIQTLPLGFFAKSLLKAKLIYDCRHLWFGIANNPMQNRVYWLIERLILPRCDATIFNTKGLGEQIKKLYGINPSLILWLSSNPIDPSEREDILGLLPDTDQADRIHEMGHKKILHIGYLFCNRGIEQLIDCMEYVPSSVLIFLGPDEAGRKKYSPIVEAKPWRDRILFINPVPGEQVADYAASCDIGVAPLHKKSLHVYLTIPNKVFECLAAGLPMVVSDFPVMGGLVREYDVGETVDETDPRSIADGINRLIDNPERMAQVRVNIPRFQKDFSWDRQAQDLLKMYAELTENQ